MRNNNSSEFDELFKEYISIIKRMQECLLKENEGENEVEDHNGNLLTIKGNADVEKLKEMHSIILEKGKAKTREDSNSFIRGTMLKQNKYTSENPYPPQK